MGQLVVSADTLLDLGEATKYALGSDEPHTVERAVALARFVATKGLEPWEPLNPTTTAFNNFYQALGNALLFLDDKTQAELEIVELPFKSLLLSVRRYWSDSREGGWRYRCVAGITDGLSYTTAGTVHATLSAEERGDPVF